MAFHSSVRLHSPFPPFYTADSSLRYLAGVINGTTNPLCSAVAQDVSSAILKTVSINGKPAEYRSLEEQKSRLEAVYQKYKDVGGVWSRKAADVRVSHSRVNIADHSSNRYIRSK